MKVLKHISAANKVFMRKHPIAAYHSAHIKDGMCTVGHTNIQYSFPVKIKGEGCVNWLDLREALRAGVTSGHFEIPEGEVAGFVKLQLNTTSITLEANSTDGYPLIPLADRDLEIRGYILPNSLIRTAASFADPNIAADDASPRPLTGIQFKGGYIAATNGSAAFRAETTHRHLECILDSRVAALLQPCGHSTITLEQVPADFILNKEAPEPVLHCLIKVEDAEIRSKLLQGQYPDIHAVFGKPYFETALNRKMVDVALLRLAPILTDTSVVTLACRTGDVVMSASSDTPEKFAAVEIGTSPAPYDWKLEFDVDHLKLAMSTDEDEFLFGIDMNYPDRCYVNGNLLMAMSMRTESIDE